MSALQSALPKGSTADGLQAIASNGWNSVDPQYGKTITDGVKIQSLIDCALKYGVHLMREAAASLLMWFLSGRCLWAQFDLLTPIEVSSIVQQIPSVTKARKALNCEIFSLVQAGSLRDGSTFDVEVRSRCSSFHARYVVDRRSGIVTLWGDRPSNVGGSESEVLAKQLVAKAKLRVLSFRESKCLAFEAARGLVAESGPIGSLEVVPWTVPRVPQTLFLLVYRSGSLRLESSLLLYVDPRTGHVRDERTGEEVASAGLGDLLKKLSLLRSPPILSASDAVSIALRIEPFQAIVSRQNCILFAWNDITPAEAQIAAACDGKYAGPGISVNLQDGYRLRC